jgi:hypothetical protein
VPRFALDADARSRGVVNIAEHPRLILSVALAEARKDPDVFDNLLFEV